MDKLNGKTAVVTGASSGIGRAIAKMYAEEGANVVAVARRKELLEDLAAEAAGVAGTVVVYAGDMMNKEDVDGMIDFAVETFGTVDILVNNAGIVDGFRPAGEMTDEIWDRVIRINLTAPMEATRKAVNHFLEKDKPGVIINIASVGGLRGATGGAAYVAAKHGLIGLTKNTAFAYVGNNIRCVALCPGGVKTPTGTIDPAAMSKRGLKRLNAVTPASAGIFEAEGIATAALFAASDDAKLVTGAAIPVDMGWCAG